MCYPHLSSATSPAIASHTKHTSKVRVFEQILFINVFELINSSETSWTIIIFSCHLSSDFVQFQLTAFHKWCRRSKYCRWNHTSHISTQFICCGLSRLWHCRYGKWLKPIIKHYELMFIVRMLIWHCQEAPSLAHPINGICYTCMCNVYGTYYN